MNRFLSIIAKIILLTTILFGLNAFDYTAFSLATQYLSAWPVALLLALLHASVISVAVLRAAWRGWKLVGAVFLVFYALHYLLVAVEAYYLSDLLPLETAARLLINGLVVAVTFSLAAVAVHNKLQVDSQLVSSPLAERLGWSTLWRLPLAGFLYLVLFVLIGLVVFQPLALALEPVLAPDYIADFQPENPMLVLLFQFLRGMLWALLAIPLLRALRGPQIARGLIMALVFGLVMAPLNLMPNEIMPLGIQAAHTLEVFTENFLFGWVVTWLLGRPGKKL